NNVDALGGLAFIDRRRGRWPQALATLQQALLISPRDAYLLGEYGWTLCIMRRYRESERQLTRSLAIAPGQTNQDALWTTRLIGLGDARSARKAYDPLPGWRLHTQNDIGVGDIFGVINPIVYPDVFERNFDAALRAWDSAPVNTDAEQVAWVDVCLGRNAEAIAAARRASEVMSVAKDAYFGAYALAGLAEVEAHA